jgi:hypothetical protein
MVETILLPRVTSESPVVLSHSVRDGDPPHYLAVQYWWAYVHPWAVKLFERQRRRAAHFCSLS